MVLVFDVVMFSSGNAVILAESTKGAVVVGPDEVIEATEVNSSALVVTSLCGDGVKSSNDSVVIGACFGFEIDVIIFQP